MTDQDQADRSIEELRRRIRLAPSPSVLPSSSSSSILPKSTLAVSLSTLPIQRGRIQVIFGPMFSGKTTELIRRIRRYTVANKKALVLKYAKDVRYNNVNSISTHNGETFEATPCTTLYPFYDTCMAFDVIGIDEGQFFNDGLDTFCDKLADAGKIVIASGLDTTFQRKPFGDMVNLAGLAEEVTKLQAICFRCIGDVDASFTKRLTSDTEVELIGGKDQYMAVCRHCYNKTT